MKKVDQPKIIKLKKGMRYSICSCGVSNRLPFCDGRHKALNQETNSNYKSIKIIPTEDIDVSLNCANWAQ